ncbi:unnamed protein product [Didymodactylos carnosus]|uniref:Uncharacterized protein n=1 Tax=Didymodactylos carnosus TaxID=1234261 RepID=A0A815H5J7_9BILA|nr:unnamed protein product [Didymodactylos carnosus]CAF1347069.1 unnamed protein product [Didymodactylos carnosus]CAF3784761.1 unnamed protein product [Didymodactylos carnosus]CAF4213885.1 unnamed protein product [Didymodactylos carnosus]
MGIPDIELNAINVPVKLVNEKTDMTDFALETQILEMIKQEFLKIALSINESITWDQDENILKRLFISSSKRERDDILYDVDKDCYLQNFIRTFQ